MHPRMERSRREREFHEFSLELLGFIWDFSALSRPQALLRGGKLDFNWIYLGFGVVWGEKSFPGGEIPAWNSSLGFWGIFISYLGIFALDFGGFIPHFWGFRSWFWGFFAPDFGVFTPILIPFSLLLFPPGFGCKTPKFGSRKQEIIEKKKENLDFPPQFSSLNSA